MDILYAIIPGIIVYLLLVFSGYLKYKKYNSSIALICNIFTFAGSISYIYYLLSHEFYYGTAFFIIFYIEGKVTQVLLEVDGKK